MSPLPGSSVSRSILPFLGLQHPPTLHTARFGSSFLTAGISLSHQKQFLVGKDRFSFTFVFLELLAKGTQQAFNN